MIKKRAVITLGYLREKHPHKYEHTHNLTSTKPNEQVVEPVIVVKLFVGFGGHGQVQQGAASDVLRNVQFA